MGSEALGGRRAIRAVLHVTGGHHRRLVAAAVAAVVVAGTAGGYVSFASTTAVSSARRYHAASGGARPAAITRSSAGGAVAGPAGSSAVACPMTAGGVDTTGGDGGLGSATHLFTRTTTDGVTIRAYGMASSGLCSCGPIPGGPTASAAPGTSSSDSSQSGSVGGVVSTGGGTALSPGRSVALEFSNETAVGQGTLFDSGSPVAVAVTPDATTGTGDGTEPVTAISGVFGVPEGTPVWWVAVAVGPEVAGAEMTFADGSTDQMTPVDGVAVLAHVIDPSVASSGDGPYEVRGTLALTDSSGAVIATVTFPDSPPPPGPLPVVGPAKAPGAGNEVTPPTTRASKTVTTPAVTQASPPITNNVMIACPDVTAPAAAWGAGGVASEG